MGAKAFLSKAFPFLSVAATAFGGPIGTAGASVLGAALGKEVKPEAIEAELTKLTGTEEGRLKAQEAEANFKLQMEKLGFAHIEELERIVAADRASARQREVLIKDKVPALLAVVVNAAFFGVIFSLIFRTFPEGSRDTLLILLGALAAGWKDVFGYYFGSSSSSARKDDTIAKLGNGHTR